MFFNGIFYFGFKQSGSGLCHPKNRGRHICAVFLYRSVMGGTQLRDDLYTGDIEWEKYVNQFVQSKILCCTMMLTKVGDGNYAKWTITMTTMTIKDTYSIESIDLMKIKILKGKVRLIRLT